MGTKQEQIQEWSKLYKRPISEEEYNTEICANLNGFFATLRNWDDEERIKLENERTCSIGNPNHTNQA